MPSVEGYIICGHTDFITSFLCFDTKSWTAIDSGALIQLKDKVEFAMEMIPMQI